MPADPRFFGSAGFFPLSSIVTAAGGTSDADADIVFNGVASLEMAGPSEVSFCDTPRYAAALAETKAGAVIVTDEVAANVPSSSVTIICRSPVLGFGKVASLFHPRPSPTGVIHPHAHVSDDAVVGEGTEIGAMTVIEAGVVIGRDCLIGPFVFIGHGVVLGDGCVIHSHVSITHAVCGQGVVLHSGARIGQEGFGFAVGPDGRFVTAPQLGLVELADRVEVGANSCVDRGSLGNTYLGEGTRLDNLVQVGHNVRTGRGCVLVAQVGVSGSTVMGDYVSAGGQAGFAGHTTIGSRVRIGAQAGVMNDIAEGMEVLGSPARPKKEAIRAMIVLQRLAAVSRDPGKRKVE